MTFSSSHRAIATIVAITAVLAVAGCSSRPADEPPLGRVRGTVTMDGQPLAGVDVVFAPSVEEMYPVPPQCTIAVGRLARLTP